MHVIRPFWGPRSPSSTFSLSSFALAPAPPHISWGGARRLYRSSAPGQRPLYPTSPQPPTPLPHVYHQPADPATADKPGALCIAQQPAETHSQPLSGHSTGCLQAPATPLGWPAAPGRAVSRFAPTVAHIPLEPKHPPYPMHAVLQQATARLPSAPAVECANLSRGGRALRAAACITSRWPHALTDFAGAHPPHRNPPLCPPSACLPTGWHAPAATCMPSYAMPRPVVT
ncbi:MAG: hypothetical protein J3K34DRAFT_271608 [Monoraphidium minutum]|nr:MAG: hypothetical protein J3K34DRAFT_271608 [Monoraphidium minutum]